jgi:ATP-dependent DNA helicase HFM1/MER3
MSLLDAEIDEEAEFGPDIVGLDESVLQAVIAPAPVAGYRRESHIPHTASIGPLHAVTPLTDTSPTPTLPCIESTVAATQPPAAEPFPGGTPFPAEIANLELDGAVPEPFRSGVFGAYAVLNAVQSRVFDAVFHSDMNVAVAAPTGCGKTAIFELAITRLLLQTQYAESSSDDLEQPLPWDATPPGMSSLDSGHLDAAPVVPSVPRSKIRGKVVYLSPLKALCTERLEDWRAKFGRLGGGAQSITIGGGMMQFGGATGGNGYGSGVVQHPQYSNLDLNVVCWTGDSEESADSGDGTGALETDEGQAFQTQEGSSDRLKNGKKRRFSHSSKLLVDADLIITTPEKWDSLTRRWKDNIGVIGAIELLLIDEVHMVGAEEGGKTQAGEPGGTYSGVGEADESEQEAQRLESGSSSERGNGSSGSSRGGVLEAVVSRMRAVASSADVRRKGWPASRLRTVAVSATVPNIHDIGDWIGATPSSTFAFGSNYRPVPLTIHFLGYDCT